MGNVDPRTPCESHPISELSTVSRDQLEKLFLVVRVQPRVRLQLYRAIKMSRYIFPMPSSFGGVHKNLLWLWRVITPTNFLGHRNVWDLDVL